MDLPDLVGTRLEDEPVAGHVDLGGGDVVVVTPTRTLVYRSEGLLSDESVSAFPHDAERVDLREGRRKATFRLSYVDDDREFSVPADSVEDLLAPLLWGVLHAGGIVEADETVEGAYRFSELTLVVTSARVVKHVGAALWAEEFEQFPYADLTGLSFEEGSVATAIVLEVDGRPQRVKAPNDRARIVRETVEGAVFAYHDVASLEELRAKVAPEDDDGEPAVDLEEGGFEPLVGDSGSEGADADDTATGGETGSDDRAADPAGANATPDAGAGAAAGADDEVAARLAELAEAVQRQNELLERQEATIQQLIDELKRGR